MYLSRLSLPLADRQTQELLANPYELHRALMEALPTPAGRVLFRVEPPGRHASAAVVLVQSEDEPNWDNAGLPRSTTAEKKAFDLDLAQGARFRFRLRANPTARRKIDGGTEGKRVGLTKEEDQRAWLVRKGKRGGFRPDGVVVIDEGQVKATKPDGHTLTFRSVRFEGVLEVTDPDRLRAAVETGIGSAKAFGFGLLSVARA